MKAAKFRMSYILLGNLLNLPADVTTLCVEPNDLNDFTIFVSGPDFPEVDDLEHATECTPTFKNYTQYVMNFDDWGLEDD